MTESISLALVAYLTGGPSPWPRKDPAALAAAVGADEAADLLPALDALAEEMLTIPVSWENQTLESGTAQAKDEMGARHPDLTDDALKALGSYFSYNWK
ncbi:hypothetical protein [Nonomuraea typhae]|uniref:hypothetical protein n=1 Tax=Nonomuraea typhae TaxID=2603600 RepID=UPI0012F9A0CB|nr:hypothetical protein [Nonomuraea typhae]